MPSAMEHGRKEGDHRKSQALGILMVLEIDRLSSHQNISLQVGVISIEGNWGQTRPRMAGQNHGNKGVNEQDIKERCFYCKIRSLTFPLMKQGH